MKRVIVPLTIALALGGGVAQPAVGADNAPDSGPGVAIGHGSASGCHTAVAGFPRAPQRHLNCGVDAHSCCQETVTELLKRRA